MPVRDARLPSDSGSKQICPANLGFSPSLRSIRATHDGFALLRCNGRARHSFLPNGTQSRGEAHSAFCILHSPAAQEWYRPPPAVRPFHRLGLSLHGTLRVLLRPCRFDRGTISPGGEIVNRGFSSAGRRSVRCGGTGVFPPAGGTRAGEFRRLRAASDFANSGKVTKAPFRNLRFLKISLRQFLMLACLAHPARGQKSKEQLLLRPLPLVV